MKKSWVATVKFAQLVPPRDWKVTFLDTGTIFGNKYLMTDFFSKLSENIAKYYHYQLIKNLETVRSSTGDDLSEKAIGLLFCSYMKEKKIHKLGLLFGKLTNQNFVELTYFSIFLE